MPETTRWEFYRKLETTTVYLPSMLTRPIFWRMIPVRSIPTRAGSVVREMSHPPKCAAMQRAASPKRGPPGAASSPIIEYTMPHRSRPRRKRHSVLANFLYVGQNGCGQAFLHPVGSQDGVSSRPWHREQKT